MSLVCCPALLARDSLPVHKAGLSETLLFRFAESTFQSWWLVGVPSSSKSVVRMRTQKDVLRSVVRVFSSALIEFFRADVVCAKSRRGVHPFQLPRERFVHTSFLMGLAGVLLAGSLDRDPGLLPEGTGSGSHRGIADRLVRVILEALENT